MAKSGSGQETKKRVCHACGEEYEYPLPGSEATRFHCDNCAGIPERVRRALERLNARLRKLEKERTGAGE